MEGRRILRLFARNLLFCVWKYTKIHSSCIVVRPYRCTSHVNTTTYITARVYIYIYIYMYRCAGFPGPLWSPLWTAPASQPAQNQKNQKKTKKTKNQRFFWFHQVVWPGQTGGQTKKNFAFLFLFYFFVFLVLLCVWQREAKPASQPVSQPASRPASFLCFCVCIYCIYSIHYAYYMYLYYRF